MNLGWPFADIYDGFFMVETGREELAHRPRRGNMSEPAEQSTAMSAAQVSVNSAKHREQGQRGGKNGDHDRLEKENNALRHQLTNLHHQFQQLKEENQQNSANFNTVRTEYTKLNILYQKAMAQVNNADSRHMMRENRLHQAQEEAQVNLQSLVAENESLREKQKASEVYMDQILKSAMKDGRWNPLPDETLRARLNRLHSDTRHWAKEWCCEHLSFDHLQSEQKADCLKMFTHFVRCKSDGSLPECVEKPNSKLKGKITPILLTAALSHLLVTEIFNKPFFCMDAEKARAMEEIYSNLQKANFQQAHVWRSTVWRILNPPQTANMSEHDKEVAQESTKRTLEQCEKIKDTFLMGPASVLFQEKKDPKDANERSSALLNILVAATEITTLIWTQRSYLTYMGIVTFIEKKMAFSTASPLMTGHPTNRIDAEDPVHNGREIVIVTQPAILAFDDDDEKGMSGDRFRVLAKAIVWLDDGKKGGIFRRDTS